MVSLYLVASILPFEQNVKLELEDNGKWRMVEEEEFRL